MGCLVTIFQADMRSHLNWWVMIVTMRGQNIKQNVDLNRPRFNLLLLKHWWWQAFIFIFVFEVKSIWNPFYLYTLMCHCLYLLYHNVMILYYWTPSLSVSPSSLHRQQVHLSSSFIHRFDWKREKQPPPSYQAVLRFTDWLLSKRACLSGYLSAWFYNHVVFVLL